MKLGKLPARPDAVKLKLANYIDTSVLPKPPAEFGHERLVTQWGMLGNDNAGCCVWSGAGHEVMLWNREAGKTVNITTTSTLRNYSLVTGYDPNDPSTDQGTDMQAAASYRLKTGLLDADGKRHKIGAYVALKPGDLTELWYATYLFDGVGIGVEFPPSGWMRSTRAGTKDQVAQLIVGEAKARNHTRDECLGEMSALYQESGGTKPSGTERTPPTAWRSRTAATRTASRARRSGQGVLRQARRQTHLTRPRRHLAQHLLAAAGAELAQRAVLVGARPPGVPHRDQVAHRDRHPVPRQVLARHRRSPVPTTDPTSTSIRCGRRTPRGRGGTKVDLFLLHTQEGDGNADSLAVPRNPASQVSYHYTSARPRMAA
jgi:hypothetical protein